MPDAASFDLSRFVTAQDPVYEAVVAELRAGEKRTHWMWFVFPQIAGLGTSGMARRYAIASREEAAAYLGHPVLAPRLVQCTSIVNALSGKSLEQIFGGIDALKFRSSMTLFAAVSAGQSPFALALAKYAEGRPDERTLELLRASDLLTPGMG
jgi:uncharacterized protein (DUF1810 family)